MYVDLNAEKATAGRDALSKSMYGHLFDWLVQRTNKAMLGSDGNSFRCVFFHYFWLSLFMKYIYRHVN